MANKDVDMKDASTDQKVDKMIELIEDTEETIPDSKEETKYVMDFKTAKTTLDRYKIEAFKDENVDNIVKDLRLTLDRIDNGKLPKELDKLIPPFIKIWIEKRFFKTQIGNQAVINGFFQYWMFKRVKKDWLDKSNFNALTQILTDDHLFYSLQYTSNSMDDMKKMNEEVKSSNPVLYKHLDDFAETSRIVYSPFYLDNVDAFCKLDGFNEIIRLLQDEQNTVSVEILREILNLSVPIMNYLKKDFMHQTFTMIIDKIITIFKEFPNEALKPISQDYLEKFINCVEFLLEEVYSKND